jgi:hypothetical protein
MDKEQTKQYNHEYYLKNKERIKANMKIWALCSTCHKIQHIKHFDSSIYRGGLQFGE